jgi:hypothetical protein
MPEQALTTPIPSTPTSSKTSLTCLAHLGRLLGFMAPAIIHVGGSSSSGLARGLQSAAMNSSGSLDGVHRERAEV